MRFEEKLIKKFRENHIELNEIQVKQFAKFYEMMVETNKHMNLTAITEEDEVIEKHFIDSVTCSKIIDMGNVRSVIDLGTGAGFPGIPLKIMYPDIKFTLIDSLNKRIKFLHEVINTLQLENIEAVHGRAEDLARKTEYRAGFDLCVSRAVANLSTLSEYCIPFVKVNGYFVSYKAQKGLEEMKSSDHCMKELGAKIEEVKEFSLGDEDNQRILIKIKKCKGTSKQYPRKAGIPSKNPL